MRLQSIARRSFIRLMAPLPFGLVLGGRTADLFAMAPLRRSSPEGALGELILLLGPWGESRKSEGESFVQRFLSSKAATGPYLPEREEEVMSVAEKVVGQALGTPTVDLRGLSDSERELVLALSSHVYGLVEVRFALSGELPSGTCSGDRTSYTLAPEERPPYPMPRP